MKDLEKKLDYLEDKLINLSFEFVFAARVKLIEFSIPEDKRIEEANQLFMNSIRANKNPMSVGSYANFMFEIGKIDEAKSLYKDVLSMEKTFKESEKSMYFRYLNDAKEFALKHKL